jgi:hypothetical protein
VFVDRLRSIVISSNLEGACEKKKQFVLNRREE